MILIIIICLHFLQSLQTNVEQIIHELLQCWLCDIKVCHTRSHYHRRAADLNVAMSIYCDKIHVTLPSTISLLLPSLILKGNENIYSLGMIHGDLCDVTCLNQAFLAEISC